MKILILKYSLKLSVAWRSNDDAEKSFGDPLSHFLSQCLSSSRRLDPDREEETP